ncbi:MAG TPA: Sua5/YciO/YrdC/YwlC family protein, partial [Solirubrobacteraceae bacterium]|nr:Sua5/YciO/YrdC/YwlC family protein [Solirubrobacteraceae bacterium]
DPEIPRAVSRLYELKGRQAGKPSAVMFFAREPALTALPDLGARLRALLERLLPGPLTVLLANPHGLFELACGEDPRTLGLRAPVLPAGAAALRAVSRPVLQSSANVAGGPVARRLDEVPEHIRRGADLVVDAGELPGTPSTVVDLRRYEADGTWTVVRAGALDAEAIAAAAAAVS